MDIQARVVDFISANLVFRDANATIDDDFDIFASGYVNSLFSLTLISFMEKNFGIEIDNSELSIENFNTVNNITNFIKKKAKIS